MEPILYYLRKDAPKEEDRHLKLTFRHYYYLIDKFHVMNPNKSLIN